MTPTRQARLAGLLYVLLTVLGGWAQLSARGRVHDAADLAANEGVLRLGLAADIGMAATFVALGWVLYNLLYTAHPRAATALFVFVCVGAGSILLNLTFHAGALIADDPAERLLLLDLHAAGYTLCGVFFGLWLVPLGTVGWRGELFPRWLGALLIAGGGAWLADPVLHFVAEPAQSVTAAITTVAELSLIPYLLIRGVRTPASKPRPQEAPQTA